MELEATPARLSQEIVAAKAMLEHSSRRDYFHANRIAADGLYGTGPSLASPLQRRLTPHIPVLDRKHQTHSEYDLSHFQDDAEHDSYTYLEGHQMPLRQAKEGARVGLLREHGNLRRMPDPEGLHQCTVPNRHPPYE